MRQFEISNSALRDHPAPFSPEILAEARDLLPRGSREQIAVDPMAGTGGAGLDLLESAGYTVVGWEIEPEWGRKDSRVRIKDFRANDHFDGAVSVIFTSPSYGNRLADRYAGSPKDMEHLAATGKIRRRTYRIALGRELSEGNAAAEQWGPEYRQLHSEIWSQCVRVLRFDGVLLLNISDHIRDGEVQPVSAWHFDTLMGMGMAMSGLRTVRTRRYRDGANRTARVPFEYLARFVR